MNIIKQDIDGNGALLKVQIIKTDYEEAVKKSLNAYRRKAEIKGFRPGMAPMSLIQKIYGHSILIDEIEKLISESLEKYIESENLEIMREPIPCYEEQKQIDFDNQIDFEFIYEIGYAPKYELKIDKTIKVPFYNISINNSDISKRVDHIRQEYGILDDAEIIDEKSIITIDINQDCENALKTENAFVNLRLIENKERFLGLKPGDTIKVDINEIYVKDEDKANLLKIKKGKLKTINPKFNFTVKTIMSIKKADVNQDLFDAVYGKDTVKNEEEFLQKVTGEIAKIYEEESNYKFSIDVSKELIKKAELKLPEAFLKKWLSLASDNKLTKEYLDRNFNFFIEDMSWEIIRNNIIKENDIKIEDDEIQTMAKQIARQRFMQYGLPNASDHQIELLAKEIISNDKQNSNIIQKIIDNKVSKYLKTAVQLDEKNINIDDFNKLLENKML
ncbi:MAG: hypothetical protein LBP85_05445 [Prevotellaceae bacterium]|jgi:trigger factor|nr:hypothetical protein [Prevotellaceae bacterium]